MLIILEGSDGVGKSTLARELASVAFAAGWDTTIENYGPPHRDEPVFNQYLRPLERLRKEILSEDHLVIFDRYHLGETIYGPLLRGQSEINEPQLTWLELRLRALGAVGAVVMASDDQIKRRFAERAIRGELDLINVENAIRVNERFIATAHDLGWSTVWPQELPDDDRDRFTMARRLLDRATLATRRVAQKIDVFDGYVGPVDPAFLFVGDRPNGYEPNQPIWPAFCPDSGENSAMYLLRALKDADASVSYGLCNANDGTPVAALWNALGRPIVVGLGRLAQETLTRRGIEHHDLPHPQWVRRFHWKDRYEYGRALLHPDLTLVNSGGRLLATARGHA